MAGMRESLRAGAFRMSPRLARLALVVGVFLALAPPALRAAETNAESAPRSQQADALFAPVVDQEAPGAAVIVIQNGEVLHQRGYGLANVELGVPITPRTKFRLASVTKQFTAAAILQLRDAGKLSLDDRVSGYLPDFPRGDEITIRHLLTHTSGLGRTERGPLEFSPGERCNYSNGGYMLLGRIIEKVSGLSYQEYLRTHLFEPLGMLNTGCDHPDTVLKNRASGYVVNPNGGYMNQPYEDIFSTAFSAGCLYSTVEDMRLWDQALYAEHVLKKETVAEAFTPVRLNDGSEAPAGFGWVIGKYRGLTEISHGGDASGFNSWVSRFPDQRFAVIVLSNLCMRPPGPIPSAHELADRIADIYLGDMMGPAEAVAQVTLDPALLSRYVGRYRLAGSQAVLDVTGDIFTVTLENGRLMARDKTAEAELVPESETEFHSAADSSIKIHFLTDETGKVTGLVARVMGVVEIRGTKLEPE